MNLKLIKIATFFLILSGFFSFEFSKYTICPFYNIVTIPCPGCGLGRAILLFAQLDFVKSFYYHPLGIIIAIFFISISLIGIKRKYYNIINYFIFLIGTIGILFGIIRIYFIKSNPEIWKKYFYDFSTTESIIKIFF